MDNLVLEGIVSELRGRLIGWPVFRITSTAPDEILVLFDDPDRSRVRASASPELPRLHLVSGRGGARFHERADMPFAAAASHHLSGAVLAAIEKPPADRVVRFRFRGAGAGGRAGAHSGADAGVGGDAGGAAPGKSLIAELFGRSSNLLVTDRDERVLTAARRLKSAFRAPAIGEPYEPPRGTAERRDPRSLTRDEIAALAARSRAEAHPLADLLLELAPAIGPLAAKEIEARFERGEDPFAALGEWLVRAHESVETGRRDRGASSSERSRERAPEEENDQAEDVQERSGPPAPERREDERRSGGEPESTQDGSQARREGTPLAVDGPPATPRAFVYSEEPIASLDLRRAPAAGGLILSPLPLVSAAPALAATPFASLNAAAEAFYDALAAGRAFRTRADGLAAIAAKEARRSSEIATRVAHDLETMEQAGSLRLYGEALLAGLSRAEKKGSEAVVPDPYDAEGRMLAIPIDPALGLAANAERYFARYRKAERGRAFAKERLEAQSRRAAALLAVAARVGDAETEDALTEIEGDLRALGLAVGLEHRARKSRRAGSGGSRGGGAASESGSGGGGGSSGPPRVEGVRLYRSSDGYEILVGKGAEENDRLTFKIAAPEDFWLHASGASGAHVVVRNPRVEKKLPPATLREAAELAAFFSKAKDAIRAEVHVTRRKYVRRVRGGPRGTVIVKKGESISVPPRNRFDSGSGPER